MREKCTPKETLSRVASCLGLGMGEIEGCEGYALYDLRDPDCIMVCSTDEEMPLKLSNIAEQLSQILDETNPEDLSFSEVRGNEADGAWDFCYGLSVILSVVDCYAGADPLADQFSRLIYQRFHSTLKEITLAAQAGIDNREPEEARREV